jgi:uncharacterized protein
LIISAFGEGGGNAVNFFFARGLDLVLIGRRKEPLEERARQLTERYGVKALPGPCDLSAADAVQQISDAIGDLPVDFLVYNAALSYIGAFLATDLSTHNGIASVNMLTPLSILHYFGGKMVERRRGGIVIMSYGHRHRDHAGGDDV